MATIEEILGKLLEEIPQFVAAECVNIESGRSLGGGNATMSPDFDPSKASAKYADLMKSNAQALQFLGVGNDDLEVLVTTHNAYVLLHPVRWDYFVLLFLTRRATVGLARAVVKKYEPMLRAALPAA